MKKSLGKKIAILFLMFVSFMHADDEVAYKLTISNEKPYLKEAVIITLDAKQKRAGGVINFAFHPRKSEQYELLFLGEEQLHDRDDLNHVRFKYALFPLKSGEISVAYSFIAKKASTQEMKEVAIGARNVLRVVKTKDREIDPGETLLHVRPLPGGVELVGDYTLETTHPQKEVPPFAQIDLSYTLKGHGYPPQLKPPLPAIEGVESFVEIERFDDKLFHKRRFHYALLAEKAFTIPAVSIKAFDPKREKIYMLETEAYKIAIKPVATEEILDSHEYPAAAPSWHEYRRYLYYLLFFIAGFLSAKLLPMLLDRYIYDREDKNPFAKQIAAVKEPKALLQLLLLEDRYRFKEEIERLEAVLYDKREISFQSILQSALKKANDGA